MGSVGAVVRVDPLKIVDLDVTESSNGCPGCETAILQCVDKHVHFVVAIVTRSPCLRRDATKGVEELDEPAAIISFGWYGSRTGWISSWCRCRCRHNCGC